MIKLSVNINKIALLRNTRNLNIPGVVESAETAIKAGAHGITLHPRPDERHIRRSDVFEIANLLKNYQRIEYNIEGNPFLPPFMDLVRSVKPAQCTLVPDDPEAFTSDHGWEINRENSKKLSPIIEELKDIGSRISLFMDPDTEQIKKAGKLDIDRIELYTEPYAASFSTDRREEVFRLYLEAARCAGEIGLGVNAGHDLNLNNLRLFASIPNLLEVSIGHALIADALILGLRGAVSEYLKLLSSR